MLEINITAARGCGEKGLKLLLEIPPPLISLPYGFFPSSILNISSLFFSFPERASS